MMTRDIIRDTRKAVQSLNLDLQGSLVISDTTSIMIFGSKLKGYRITGAIAIVGDQHSNKIHLQCKFAICSKQDTYSKKLGQEIALGRVLRMGSPQLSVEGDINIKDVVYSFLQSKLSGLNSVLAMRNEVRKKFKAARISFNSIISGELEEYL